MSEFLRKDGGKYTIEGGVFEAWFSTGESVGRWRLDAIDAVELKEKWGTRSVLFRKEDESVYSIISFADAEEAQSVASWIEQERVAASRPPSVG